MAGALPGFVTLLGSIAFVVNSESSVRTFSYDREVTTLEDAVKPEDSVRDLENEFIEDLGRVASQAEINNLSKNKMDETFSEEGEDMAEENSRVEYDKETNQETDESSRYDTERNLDEDMLPSCGSGSYNASFQGCCAGRYAYSSSTQRCCYGSVISINAPCLQKCGSGSYNASFQGCCAGKKTYFLSSQQCCQDWVMSRRSLCLLKCGRLRYNPQTHGCCGRRRYYLKKNNCCHRRPILKGTPCVPYRRCGPVKYNPLTRLLQ